MAELGVMIEAQEGLDWQSWRRVATAADRLGFASLRCSDHCMSLMGVERRSLSTWPALALAAEWTQRIQLGPMVSPVTFYIPAVLARMARAVDELCGGRLILGVGAGWNQAEHEAFGIPFPGWRQRFDQLERAIARIRQTLADHQLPILIGGGGRGRTLRIAAREAAEWNLLDADPESYPSSRQLLRERCREVGRDPAEIKCSVMAGYLIGRDHSDLLRRAARLAEFLPALSSMAPEVVVATLTEARRRWVVGTPEVVVARLRELSAAGVELFMLQHYLVDDLEALELLASEVAPFL